MSGWTRAALLIAIFVAMGMVMAGCGASGGGSAANHVDGGGADGAAGGGGSPFDASLGTPDAPPTGARLQGTVWGPHPDGSAAIFPVSGALVLAKSTPPDPIPQQAYCDSCVSVALSDPYTLSRPDGTFSLDVTPGSTFYLVVGKGQFRRVRQYTAPQTVGTFTLDDALTTLPHKTDASLGDTIPKIALVYGDYDHVEDVLAKVGIGVTDGAYGLQWGSETGFFDVYNNAGPGEPQHGAPLTDLADPAKIAGYHVVIFACSYNANFAFMNSPDSQKLLRDYVWGGGKLYVSDYAMPVVEMPWHDFAWFTDPLHGGCNENNFPPDCNHGPPFDAPASVPDPDMSAWLDSMGMLSNLTVKENWDTIGSTAPGVVGKNPSSGADVSAPPKVWVEGPWNYTNQDLTDVDIEPTTFDKSSHAFTISWPYNCGRTLFTTYHTVGSTSGGRHPDLYPQERILFYLLMELTVCQDQPVVK